MSAKNEVSIIIRVTANARKELLIVRPDGMLAIKVAAPAVDNKANLRIIELLSVWLKLPKSSISIIKGVHTKNKEIQFSGVSREELKVRLNKIIAPAQLELPNCSL